MGRKKINHKADTKKRSLLGIKKDEAAKIVPKADPKERLLMGIKKDEAEIKMYEKLLGIKKRKNKSQIEELFCYMDPDSENDNNDEGVNDEVEANEDDETELTEDSEEIDSDADAMEVIEEIDSDANAMEAIEEIDLDADTMEVIKESKNQSKATKNDTISNEEQLKIKRNILAQLNRLSESQMMKCLDGFESIWNEYPRGHVRDIFIRESINYMKLSCLELSAFVSCLHFRLIKQTNLVAFLIEQLIENLTKLNSANWSKESTFITVISGYKFIAFITRLEVIDTNLIIDLMHELAAGQFDLQHLKVLKEITSIVGFVIRKNNAKRCDQLVESLKETGKVHLSNVSYLNEIRSHYDDVINKLTTANAKNDAVLETVARYWKLMRTWCRKSVTNENLSIRLADFRGENRVRWWLVGSGVNPNVVHNKNAAASAIATAAKATAESQLTAEQLEWNRTATILGFNTDGKQRLFRQLMSSKQQHIDNGGTGVESVTEALVEINKMSSGTSQIVPMAEIVGMIVRCLALEQEFCQFYVNLLVALIASDRRCRQLTKCAVWDLIGQPKLVQSVRINIGRALGQLIGGAGFPVNSLRKFNFLDNSPENVSFMIAVISELVENSWADVCRLLSEMLSSISEKFANNLRIFLKKNFKPDSNEKFSTVTIAKVNKCVEYLGELRRNGS